MPTATDDPPDWQYDDRFRPIAACQYDTRFSYCLSVPRRARAQRSPIIVVVHGSGRDCQEYRKRFADFADEAGCYLLAPLFPVGIHGLNDTENYKFVAHRGIRYDRVLLAMVEEVAAQFPIDSSRILLHGFSGGAHFAHRFFYAQPTRLAAVSIGAPGVVTLLDDTRPWWVGVSDFERIFGTAIDLPAMRGVPVQMVIGSNDTSPEGITLRPTSQWWMEGITDSGLNRVERLQSLRASFERHGIPVRFDSVPGPAHEGWHPALLASVCAFFMDVLGKTCVARASR